MHEGMRVRHRQGWTGVVARPCIDRSHLACFLVTPDHMPKHLALHARKDVDVRPDTGEVWVQPERPVCYYCEKPATSAEHGYWCCGRPECHKWGEQMREVYPGEKIPAGVRT